MALSWTVRPTGELYVRFSALQPDRRVVALLLSWCSVVLSAFYRYLVISGASHIFCFAEVDFENEVCLLPGAVDRISITTGESWHDGDRSAQ